MTARGMPLRSSSATISAISASRSVYGLCAAPPRSFLAGGDEERGMLRIFTRFFAKTKAGRWRALLSSWNQREMTDGERTVSGIAKARGKRLTYKAIKQATP